MWQPEVLILCVQIKKAPMAWPLDFDKVRLNLMWRNCVIGRMTSALSSTSNLYIYILLRFSKQFAEANWRLILFERSLYWRSICTYNYVYIYLYLCVLSIHKVYTPWSNKIRYNLNPMLLGCMWVTYIQYKKCTMHAWSNKLIYIDQFKTCTVVNKL